MLPRRRSLPSACRAAGARRRPPLLLCVSLKTPPAPPLDTLTPPQKNKRARCSDSVTRKALWYARPWPLLPLCARTVARCTAPFYLADFTVACGYAAAGAVLDRRPQPARKRAARVADAAARHAARVILTWAAAAGGAALIATLAPPETAGRWAGYGHLLTDVVVGNGVAFVLLQPAAGAGAADAPDVGGGGHGGPHGGGGGHHHGGHHHGAAATELVLEGDPGPALDALTGATLGGGGGVGWDAPGMQ